MSLKILNISGPSWIQDQSGQRLFNRELNSQTASIYLRTPPACHLESTPSRLVLIDSHLILEPTTSEHNERLFLVNLAAIGERDDDNYNYDKVNDFILAEDYCRLVEHWFVERMIGINKKGRQHCLSVLIKALTNEARVAFFFSTEGCKHILLASDVRGIRTHHFDTAVFSQDFIYDRVLKEVYDWTSFRLDELSVSSKTPMTYLDKIVSKLRRSLGL
ncbi:hypothetical protein IJJ08_01050 [bacterium]|nr:hypothetical protein [bacterium]